MDYRDTPAARPTVDALRAGDVITPRQAENLEPDTLRTRGLCLQYDGDGLGGTAVAVVEAL